MPASASPSKLLFQRGFYRLIYRLCITMPPRIFFAPGASPAGQAPWNNPASSVCCTSLLPLTCTVVSALRVYALARSPLNVTASLVSGQLDWKW